MVQHICMPFTEGFCVVRDTVLDKPRPMFNAALQACHHLLEFVELAATALQNAPSDTQTDGGGDALMSQAAEGPPVSAADLRKFALETLYVVTRRGEVIGKDPTGV